MVAAPGPEPGGRSGEVRDVSASRVPATVAVAPPASSLVEGRRRRVRPCGAGGSAPLGGRGGGAVVVVAPRVDGPHPRRRPWSGGGGPARSVPARRRAGPRGALPGRHRRRRGARPVGSGLGCRLARGGAEAGPLPRGHRPGPSLVLERRCALLAQVIGGRLRPDESRIGRAGALDFSWSQAHIRLEPGTAALSRRAGRRS